MNVLNKIYNYLPPRFQKPLILFFCVMAFVITTSLTYIFLAVKDASRGKEERAEVVSAQPLTTISGAVNFVLLGHGGPGHEAGNLMDSIILVSADTKNKKLLAVSVPRDLWIEGRKINEGYVDGGYDLIKHQINTITGIFPDNYVAVDFDQFVHLINELGGVDAKITKAYEDRYYPIRGKEIDTCGKSSEEFAELHQKYSGYQLEIQFECRYEHIKYDVGTAHMTGDEALKYVRSRHGDGDFGRSERQFVILAAIKDKVLSLELLKNFGPVFKELFKTVKTNLNIEEVMRLSQVFLNPDEYKVKEIHLTDANVLKQGKTSGGAFILLPREGDDKWDGIKSFIASQTQEN